MRLMFLGDRITGGKSAYAKLGYEICTRLANSGYNVAHTPIGRANKMGKQIYNNVLIQNSGDDYFSEDNALSNYTDFKADMLISIKDTWVFNHIYKLAINYVPFAVIDHSPVSNAITLRLETAFKTIAISRFGQMELRRKRIDSTYIPHAVDCEAFKPLSKEDKLEARKIFGLPENAFVIGVVAMNRARKMIPRMLRGFKRFREMNPDVDARMMLWTNMQPRRPAEDITLGVSDVGVNLLPEIIELGINEYVHFPDWADVEKIGGLVDAGDPNKRDMQHLYNTFDVNFLCSGGEGAGLPYLEANACGVPSIGTNYAAAPEYIGPGLTVPWHDYVIINTPGVRYALADIDGMAAALQKVYDGDREKLSAKCRKFAETYDWNLVMDTYWKPFLEKCAKELHPLLTSEGETSW